MSPGKIGAQCGHAFLDLGLMVAESDPDRLTQYKTNHGIKVVMKAKSLVALERAYNEAILAGIPAVLVTDLGFYGVAPGLEGKATVTVLGLGPVRRSEVNRITKRFQLME